MLKLIRKKSIQLRLFWAFVVIPLVWMLIVFGFYYFTHRETGVGDASLLQQFDFAKDVMIIYGASLLVLLLILTTIIYHSIYDPIHKILKTMQDYSQPHTSDTKIIDEGNDEIHTLANCTNDLLDRVDHLIDRVQFEQEQKRTTQIQLLQAQINPHFLFNTLSTLHFLAIMNEDKPVSEGIGALAKLLRNTIVDSKEHVSVQEELDNIKNYIIIQKLRFGSMFETIYNIDEDVLQCQILKFLLQPIVENSIIHGFEENKQHQLLSIRVKKDNEYLRIEIGDNGKGFKKTSKVGSQLSGIGIENIRERITLMYGEAYRMNIDSVINQGTIVTMLLPLKVGDAHV